MKSEKQVQAKLEALVSELTKLTDELEKAGQKSELPGDKVGEISALVVGFMLLAWVLDAEEGLAPLIQHLKFAVAVDGLGGL